MRNEKFTVPALVLYLLQNPNKTLAQGLDAVAPGMDELGLFPEESDAIDDAIVICNNCSLWTRVKEINADGNCGDCEPDDFFLTPHGYDD